jgi:putative sterol carrier protein
MAVFESTEKMTKVMDDVFTPVFNDAKTGPKFKKANLVLKFILNDPVGDIYVDTGKSIIIDGEYDHKPNIELTADADVIHDFLLRKINIAEALGAKKIKIKGPILQIMKMIPLLSKAFDNYPEIVKKHGI